MQIPSEAESGILRSSLDRDGKRTLSGMVRTGRQPPPDLHVHSSEVCFLSPTSSPTPAAEFKILATRRGFRGGHCRLTVWWSHPVGTQAHLPAKRPSPRGSGGVGKETRSLGTSACCCCCCFNMENAISLSTEVDQSLCC